MKTDDPVSRVEFEALKAELAELKLSRFKRAGIQLKKHKGLTISVFAALVLAPISLYTLNITKSFTFAAGTPTVASEINTNFDQLFTKVNDLAAYHPPIGSIIAWHKDMLGGTPALPSEWVECNGQTLTGESLSPYNNRVIPNLNGAASGADSPGQTQKLAMFLRGGTTSGTGQEDAFQGHRHSFYQNGTLGSDWDVPGSLIRTGPGNTPMERITDPITDGTHGTPRTASETRPVNMSVVWIMKVK